ncbi:MAG: DUF1080 domain-containing protein [Prevotellaceae bacterium]|jgi:hypothetical protein|nr:DUF1080 domain-containing protein [Prevotellaceae bacterium]
MKIKNVFTGLLALGIITSVSSCGGGSKIVKKDYVIQTSEIEVPAQDSLTPGYTIIEKTQVDLSCFPKDKDGWITIFDGKDFYGWRGYCKDNVPSRWIIEDGAIKFNGSGAGEAQAKDGGDIIFAHKFKNFEVSIDWKVAKGSNSGIFYLAQEIKNQPIYVSAPESQVLDNDNHPDAKLGVDNNRQSSSLYDMIPAKPQNAKPHGEWNNTTITVFKGTVIHSQNGKTVLEYHLWTPQWTEMLQNCKFSQQRWPVAFALLNNCGGEKHEGYIGLQDHGDDVWFKNIKVKITD